MNIFLRSIQNIFSLHLIFFFLVSKNNTEGNIGECTVECVLSTTR